MTHGDGLVGWTVYTPATADLPGWYVVRPWLVTRGEAHWPFTIAVCWPEGWVCHAFVGCCYATLAEARADLRHTGLAWLGRELSDDPVIVETWV